MVSGLFEGPLTLSMETSLFDAKGLVINYGEGGIQNGNIVGLKLFALHLLKTE